MHVSLLPSSLLLFCGLLTEVLPTKSEMLEIFCAGFLQLAGGTNAHTVHALKKEGLFQSPNKPGGRDAAIAGVAYGGYARKVHP
jgi:hypothetical protein